MDFWDFPLFRAEARRSSLGVEALRGHRPFQVWCQVLRLPIMPRPTQVEALGTLGFEFVALKRFAVNLSEQQMAKRVPHMNSARRFAQSCDSGFVQNDLEGVGKLTPRF